MALEAAVEGSELYCYKTDGDGISVVSQAQCRMGWTLLQLQAETSVEKRTIHEILRKDFQIFICVKLRRSGCHALTEAEKWTRYAICHLLFFSFLFKIRIIHISKGT